MVLDKDDDRANARPLATTFVEEHQLIDLVTEVEGLPV
jgi:hypothetical protein